jgi:hypothetical protein
MYTGIPKINFKKILKIFINNLLFLISILRIGMVAECA